MSGFWTSGTGITPTGRPEDAFVSDFSIIPEGTCADALIKSFVLIEKENKFSNKNDKFYAITWKLVNGDFKSREVTQKIKCFDGKPEQIDRALNMLKLIMQLCDFKPTHNEAPQDIELIPMLNKILSIKIGEWSMPKQDGGIMEGNFVRECWRAGELGTETGVKAVVEHKPTRGVESALTRNAGMPELSDDLPF
jgi:hypothetical protein